VRGDLARGWIDIYHEDQANRRAGEGQAGKYRYSSTSLVTNPKIPAASLAAAILFLAAKDAAHFWQSLLFVLVL
jgi:hypothetical protein